MVDGPLRLMLTIFTTVSGALSPVIQGAARVVFPEIEPDGGAPRLELRSPPSAHGNLVALVCVAGHLKTNASADVPGLAVLYN